jgi:undecaprenyl-diphosphatase
MLLGLIQGATEFLPVSSSGHLSLAQMMIPKEELEQSIPLQPLGLEVLLHLATLLCVTIFFRREVWDCLVGAGRGVRAVFQGGLGELAGRDEGVRFAIAIVAGCVSTAIIGVSIRHVAEFVSTSSTWLGVSFLVCAIILFVSRYWSGGHKELDWKTGFIIGIVQGFAVMPGISRSGITIAIALALGLESKTAFRFSFILSLPVILGAALLELDIGPIVRNENLDMYLLGGLVAFITGYGALVVLDRIVQRGRLWVFSPYVGAIAIGTLAFL